MEEPGGLTRLLGEALPRGGGQFLLTLGEGRSITAVRRCQEAPVTVGRSSQCGLRLPDPRFPRVAGEFILHPLPLFRPAVSASRGGDRSPSVQPVKPGAVIPLGRFRLRLLPPGAATWNPRAGGTARRLGLACGLLLALTLLLASAATGRRDPAPSPGEPPREKAAASALAVPPIREVPAAPRAGWLSSTLPAGRPVPSAPRRRSPHRRAPAASPPAGERGGSTVSGRGVGQAALDQAVLLAGEAFRANDPRRGGTLIAPFLPLLSAEQSRQVTASLEALATPIFRRAYMERPFDREGSARILAGLAECGLPDLPSAVKARDLIKGEDHAR